MATAPLEFPPRPDVRRGIAGFALTHGAGVAWIAIALFICTMDVSARAVTVAQAAGGLLLGAALGAGCEWIDRAWHARTGTTPDVWSRRQFRAQAHVLLPYFAVLLVLVVLTLNAHGHATGVFMSATWGFTSAWIVFTQPRHRRNPALRT